MFRSTKALILQIDYFLQSNAENSHFVEYILPLNKIITHVQIPQGEISTSSLLLVTIRLVLLSSESTTLLFIYHHNIFFQVKCG